MTTKQQNLIKQQNPLSSHFRTAVKQVKIPSAGKYYTEDVFEPANSFGEVPIFAMTTQDELQLRNPEALLNGAAMEQVMRSCVPNIKNARKMLKVDVDTLFIAIQAATYGDDLTVSAVCPKCDNAAEGVINYSEVEALMSSKEEVQDSYIVEKKGTDSDLEIRIKPFDYADHVKAGRIGFETAKDWELLANADDAEKIKLYTKPFETMANLSFDLTLDSIESITLNYHDTTKDSFVVVDKDMIREFLVNSDQSIGKEIDRQIGEINTFVDIEMEFTCENKECKGEGEGHTFVSKANFDPVNFSTAS